MDSLVPPQPANRATEFVDKLNLGYNLELRVPDLRLSPRKRREAQITPEDALAEHIHSLIRRLASQFPDALPELEVRFKQEARAICNNWVPKPRAPPGLLPVNGLPRASNAVERAQLRECLLKTTQSCHDDITQRRAQPRQAQLFRCRKRRSDEALQEPDSGPPTPQRSPSKKAKSALDGVPNRFDERVAISANQSFGFNDTANYPRPYHSFSGLPPPAPQPPGPHRSANSPSPPSRVTTATRSFGPRDHRSMNQESADTSMITTDSTIFSFAPYDSDSSQATVPNDDREEYYKAVALAAGPRTPTRPDPVEPAAALNNGTDLYFSSTPFTSSEEAALMALDAPAPEGCGIEPPGAPGAWGEASEYLNPPDVIPRGLDQSAAPGTGAKFVIRQRGPVSSAPSIPETQGTDWSADMDSQLPVYGGGLRPGPDEPSPLDEPTVPDEPFVRQKPPTLAKRFRDSWPTLPDFLTNAPLPIIWELTRTALHCGVRLDSLHMEYNDSWHDLTRFRQVLTTHDEFRGKTLPERCDGRAWKAAFSDFWHQGLSVSLVIEASYNHEKDGPLYSLRLQPLKVEDGHRLARRFGADRFLEFIVPSPTGKDKPRGLKMDELLDLFHQSDYILLGRLWRSFFTKDDKKVEKHDLPTGTTETKTLPQERLYLFAVDGNDFIRPKTCAIPPKEEATSMARRTKMTIVSLLEWAISLSRNTDQSILKLFSRLALSLSRTTPTVVLEKHQIIHHADDLRSPTGEIMNDGIGRISPTLAKAVTQHLGLDSEMPSGFQARIGPYKGFWLVDSSDDNGEIWIEGYPSQRKWKCDLDDEHHRTFEVKEAARRLTPGALNEQFIPVLEDRARDPLKMRKAIKLLLTKTVQEYLQEQTSAASDRNALYAWAHQNGSASRLDKIVTGLIPYLGGLPKSDEETVKAFLDAGFDPGMKYILELILKLARQRCDKLKEKMKITVPKSAYIFMVIDFDGVLEEGEVHLSFSRGTECDTSRSEGGISQNELDDQHVLVARAPAHFPSDVQKVKAVFKRELRHLQNVIVFSSKGNVPLAELLSGGDYDGDKAWVCWDPSIVDEFQNAAVPEKEDLFEKGYLAKDRRTFQDALQSTRGNSLEDAVSVFLRDSFAFNMQPSLLGICTNYKEKVCYRTRSVSNEKAIILSTLASHLVDQAKQGIIFTDDDFRRLKSELIKESFGKGEEPAYKKENYSGRGTPQHVLDWLKFDVAKPLIEHGLNKFNDDISRGRGPDLPDPDLGYYQRELEELADGGDGSKSYRELRRVLHKEIYEVFDHWMNSPASFQDKVEACHGMWLAIRPCKRALRKDTLRYMLVGTQDEPDSLSYWGRIKASVTFRLLYAKSPEFVWRVAGRQLLVIKPAIKCVGEGKYPVGLMPEMHAVHRPDMKIITAQAAKKGEGVFGGGSDGGEGDDA